MLARMASGRASNGDGVAGSGASALASAAGGAGEGSAAGAAAGAAADSTGAVDDAGGVEHALAARISRDRAARRMEGLRRRLTMMAVLSVHPGVVVAEADRVEGGADGRVRAAAE